MFYFWKTLLFLLIISVIVLKIVRTDDSPPDMCLHSSRFDSLTQYRGLDQNNTAKLRHFFSSHSYYWMLAPKDFPTANNSRGRLPHGFRGDASYFRHFKRCEDMKIGVPMIIVVDNIDGKKLNYLIYHILNDSWSERLTIESKYDPILERLQEVYIYNTKMATTFSIDTIMNFANIITGPFGNRLGDEFLYLLTSTQYRKMYYSSIMFKGCIQLNGTLKGTMVGSQAFFLDSVDSSWEINQRVDAAMLYINYPTSKLNDVPKEADISLFEGNTHFQFTVSLETISNGVFKINRKELLSQYYSTWMGCAVGETPEPPFNPNPDDNKMTTVVGHNNGSIYESGVDSNETLEPTLKWREPIEHEDPVHHSSHEDDGTLAVSLISGLIVFTVGTIILTIMSFMFCFKKDSKDKTEK